MSKDHQGHLSSYLTGFHSHFKLIKFLTVLAPIDGQNLETRDSILYLVTGSQEPQCARFRRVFTCPPIV